VTTNLTVRVFPFASVAAQLTIVRPIRNRLPDFGVHVTGPTAPSLSKAERVKRTRTPVDPFGARMVFATAPVRVGGVTSKSRPGTSRFASQMSRPVFPPVAVGIVL
jgi:hypothetical protein